MSNPYDMPESEREYVAPISRTPSDRLDDYPRMSYSLVVDIPHPDYRGPGIAETSTRKTGAHVDYFKGEIPSHVYDVMRAAFLCGSHRVEILDGLNSYKAYRQPPQIEDPQKVSEVDFEEGSSEIKAYK